MRTIIQLRSGDPFTGIFQKMGPSVTTALMVALGLYCLYLAKTSGLLWNDDEAACEFFNGLTNLNSCRSGYLFNISWSLTMAILFPAIFYVVTRLYSGISDAVLSVGDQEFLARVIEKINAKWIMSLYVLLPILWYFYFSSILESDSWMWNFEAPSCEGKENCFIVAEAWNSITHLGILTTLYHIFNGLFIICLVRAILVGKLISEEISSRPEKFSFADSDGVYGFSKLRSLLKDVYLIIGLLTIYIFSYILDKIFIQQESINSVLIIATIYSTSWLLFVWLVQQKVTNPIENIMHKIKNAELDKLEQKIKQKESKGEAYNHLLDTKAHIEKLPEHIIVFKFWKTLGSAPVISVLSVILAEVIRNETT